MKKPNIFNIPSNQNFLKSLACWVLETYSKEYPNSFYLSNITILLPSRRACRQMKEIFLEMAENEVVILPRILAIGDVDYDEVFTRFISNPPPHRLRSATSPQGGSDYPSRGFGDSIMVSDNKIHYYLQLIQAIKNWNDKTNLFGKNTSISAISEIANNLQSFLDEVEKEGLNLDDLIEVEDFELANHKQQILQFLRYFGSEWQNFLARNNLISAAKSRNEMIKSYNENLQKNGSLYPIIAAGSTGSVKEVALLLRTISRLENGNVVLFGLDKKISEEIWQKIDENHPQFTLKKLLERMEIEKKDVGEIRFEQFRQASDFVGDLSSLAMLPAQFSDLWREDGLFVGDGKRGDYSPLEGESESVSDPVGGREALEHNTYSNLNISNPSPNQQVGLTLPQGEGYGTEFQSKTYLFQPQREGDNTGNYKKVLNKKYIQANKFYSQQTLERAKNLRQNQTDAESLLWYYLRNRQLNNFKFRRQHTIGKYIADFVCLEKKTIVELDGGQHGEEENIRYDVSRDNFLRNSGFKVLRFWNDEISKNIDGVLDFILNEMNQENEATNLPQLFPIEDDKTNFISNISLIKTENEFDEARLIALIFRKTLEEPNKKVALISNNKNLITAIKANLLEWNIVVNDSESSNLAESKLANYLFLISELVSEFSAINLLAFLKHPLTKCKMDGEFYRGNLLKLELEILRGVNNFENFEELIVELELAGDNDLAGFIKNISQLLKPFFAEFRKENINFIEVLTIHFNCLSSLIGNFETELSNDLEKSNIEGAKEFIKFYQEIIANNIHFNLDKSSYSHLLRNLLSKYQFRKYEKFHPRLHILSTMEARLINFDLTIVSSLIEGEFPSQNGDDWLGNKIRTDFGLPSLNKQIGTSAYDFCNYLGGKEVILTYSKNQNNSPVITSRFILKMLAVLKINHLENWLKNGQEYLQLLAKDSNIPKQITNRPHPKPKVKLSKISATDISKWMRDPYFIYAKRILNLKPLEPIAKQASFAEFGNFVHKILEDFIRNSDEIDPEKRLNFLVGKNGRDIFAKYFPDPTSHLLWWSRFENIAKWFLKKENSNLESFAEIEAEALIDNVLVTTKIDRINFYTDGSLEIIDYKTGQLPSDKEINSGIEPQLAMEAIILSKGKIKNYPELNGRISVDKIKNLQYQNLKGRNLNEVKDLKNPDQLINAAENEFCRLLEIFTHQNYGYICCPNFDIYKKNDYWHLERIAEWE